MGFKFVSSGRIAAEYIKENGELQSTQQCEQIFLFEQIDIYQ